jgi:indolepyruvate ferredoxin oxidoreductase
MLAYAWQLGLIPLSFGAIHKAIELNGVAIKANQKTFACGRMAVYDMAALKEFVQPYLNASFHDEISENVSDIIETRANNLVKYQDEDYANKFTKLINKVGDKDQGKIYEAVARSYFKLLAIKDEYEVARLYTNGDFLKKLNAQFDGDFKLKFHMAPPIFEKNNDAGEVQKHEFGPWMMTSLKLIAKLKFLRGTLFDVFGYSAERKMERSLIKEYETLVPKVLDRLTKENYELCLEILELPLSYKGYGHVKEKNVEKEKLRLEKLLKQLEEFESIKKAS